MRTRLLVIGANCANCAIGAIAAAVVASAAAQTPSAVPANAGTSASAAPASTTASIPGAAPLLSFQRVLDRANRPQPQQRVPYGSAAQQFGELWLPDGPGPHPVVVLIHGGCWMAELPGPELMAWQAEALRQQGWAVWSISYRRVGHEGGGYPGTFQDVALAADNLRQLATQYPLDLGRVTASGHSAGGHLALWLAGRKNIAAGSPLHADNPLVLQAVVPVAGIGDLAWATPYISTVCSAGIIPKLVDEATRGKEAWTDTSPTQLAPLAVPVTMVSGIYDPIVPPTHAWRFWQVASAKGQVNLTLLNLDGAGHFELIAPWTVPGQAVVRAIIGK